MNQIDFENNFLKLESFTKIRIILLVTVLLVTVLVVIILVVIVLVVRGSYCCYIDPYNLSFAISNKNFSPNVFAHLLYLKYYLKIMFTFKKIIF